MYNVIDLFDSPQKPIRQFEGPLSKTMFAKVQALNSKYPDTFDWSIYDRLHARFGEEQPRGGVIFKTAFKLVNHHSSCSKCHYAFEIDSYGRGCIHNCAFCYAKDQLTTHGFWNRPIPFPVDLAEVRKIMHTVFETDRPSKWRDIMSKRVPVRIGSMSDSFMWIDQKYGVTKELIKILNFYRYPHIVFTRSDLAAHDDYLSLLDKELVSIQYSISGNNEHYTKLIEPGAPSYARRIAALEKLGKAGFWTTVRINPFFPMRPDGYYTDREKLVQRFGTEENIPSFDLFSWDMLDDLKSANVPSVLAGVVRLSSTAIINMTQATGVDFRQFFKPEVLSGHGDKKYSDPEVQVYYLKMASEARKRGVRFGTCYIGNGIKDYYQYQNTWSNKSDCCDVIGNVPAFKTTSQTITWPERERHAPHKPEAHKARELESTMDMGRNTPTAQSVAKEELVEL